MPAKKPKSLLGGHQTNSEKELRADAELSLSPRSDLPDLPVKLKGHKTATEEWRYLMKLYSELDAEVVSSLDLRLLVDYCLLIEQLAELDTLRMATFGMLDALNKKQRGKKKESDTELAGSIGYIVDAVVKVDARVDRKRALLLTLSQSLYLTPRSRAGYVPHKKPAPVPPDEMEDILGSLDE